MLRRLLVAMSVLVLGCGSSPSSEDGGAGGGTAAGGGVASGGGSASGGGTGGGLGSGGGAGAGGGAPVTTLYFDPTAGLDSNDCSQAKPCKTVSHGLAIAKAGQTLVLAAGAYSLASGETFDAGVPDGLTIQGASATNRAVVVGDGTTTWPFQLAGGASFKDLDIASVDVGIMAHSGTTRLDGVHFVGANTAVYADTTALVNGAAVDISDGGQGFNLQGLAVLTLTDGGISGMGPNCRGSVGIGSTGDSSTVNLINMDIHDNRGALELRSSSQAFVTGSKLANNGYIGCGGPYAIELLEATRAQLTNTDISSNVANDAVSARGVSTFTATGGTISRAIEVEYGSVTLNQVNLVGYADTSALYLSGPADVTLNGGEVHGVTGTRAAIYAGQGRVTLNGANIHDNGIGVYVFTDVAQLYMDVTSSRAANTLRNNTSAGLVVSGTTTRTVNVSGNTWTPSKDGADAQGHMSAHLLTGPYTSQGNVSIAGAGPKLQF